MTHLRERREVLKLIESHPAISILSADNYKGTHRTPPADLAKVSLFRRLMGDFAVQQVWIERWRQDVPSELDQRIREAFPEAEILESLPEPCHPGCFPRGTLVETPLGPRSIELFQPNDLVFAIGRDNVFMVIPVQDVFVTTNRLWSIEVTDGILETTETQPLCLPAFQIRAAGKLQSGDSILRYESGSVRSVEVLSAEPNGKTETVFNLVLGNCECFVANGYLARSKPPAHAAASSAANLTD
jgi:hypothetical protein